MPQPSRSSSDAKARPKTAPPAQRHRIEVRINVYDLLPRGRLANALWNLGCGLLHSGVVINGKEFAFGGHAKPNVSGVYWTPPEYLPPGGTFRCTILHGFTLCSEEELDAVIFAASHKFLGAEWHLLKNNCNHFTNYLCEQLTGRQAPRWLNRASTIGVAFPCLIPDYWVTAPDSTTQQGELVDEGSGADTDASEREYDERRPMLQSSRRGRQREYDDDDDMSYEGSATEDERSPSPRRERRPSSGKQPRNKYVTGVDSGGYLLPPSERAPLPRR